MQRVLFICHGNICRSTMAESVFTELVRRAGRAGEFVIDSAATSTEEIGNPPHHGTIAKLREVGFPSSHIAHVRCVARSMATGTTLSIWTTRTPAPCTEFLGRTPMARSRACSIGPIAPATWPTPGTPAISTPPTAMYSPVAPPCSSSCRRSGGAGTRATPSA